MRERKITILVSSNYLNYMPQRWSRSWNTWVPESTSFAGAAPSVKRNFWPLRNFWPINVCQLFCFSA